MNKSSVSGILWLFISKFFPPIINFSVFTYTARILAPEDFGLVALALSIVFIASSFMPSGWRGAIIKYQLDDKKSISSVFWLNFIISIVLALVILSFVYFSIFEFQTEVFNAALMLLTIKLVFDGLFYTLNMLLLKQRLYSLIAIRTVITSVIAACIIVVLIIYDFGIWALIWSQIILSIANFIAVFLPTRQYLCFCLNLKTLKKMNSFAVYTTLTDGYTAILDQYEVVIIGSVLGTRELGFFNVAKRLTKIMNDIFIGTVSEISFPVLAASQSNHERFKKSFLTSVYLSVVCLFPIFIFCLVSADSIIVFLFTEKWLDASIVFQTFCIIFLFVILGIPQKNIIVLSGYAKWWFKLQLKLSFIIVPLTIVSVYWGIHYLLLVLILGKCLFCSASMYKSCNILVIDIKTYLANLYIPVVCCITSALLVAWLIKFTLTFDFLLINILVSVLIYLSTYFILLYLFARKKIISIANQFFPNNQFLARFNI